MKRLTPLAVALFAACAAAPAVTLPASSATSALPASSSASAMAEPPPRSDHGSGPDGCFTRDDLAKREAEAKADREATYVEALRRVGLEPTHLASYTLVQANQELTGPPVAAHVEDRDVGGGKHARVVVMPATGGCGDLAGAFEFARSANRVWAVARRVKSRRVDVTLCGCPTCKCEPQRFGGCGGRRVVADTILGFELPGGTEFAGEREVWYVEDFVSVQRELPPQPVCAAVAPPP